MYLPLSLTPDIRAQMSAGEYLAYLDVGLWVESALFHVVVNKHFKEKAQKQ